jgi:hypothetical protein
VIIEGQRYDIIFYRFYNAFQQLLINPVCYLLVLIKSKSLTRPLGLTTFAEASEGKDSLNNVMYNKWISIHAKVHQVEQQMKQKCEFQCKAVKKSYKC